MNFDLFLNITTVLTVVALFCFFYFRQKALLQFFQQEEYESDRFLRWVWDKKAFDVKTSLVVLVALGLDNIYLSSILSQSSDPFPYGQVLAVKLLYVIAFIWGVVISRNILNNSKKPLVMTMRAKRILSLSMVLVVPVIVFANTLNSLPFALLVIFQLPPLLLVLADTFLKPFEWRVKNKFLQEAKDKMGQLNPTVIGITGSYGKTSTKHILSHILSASAPTLATPGSVNTQMGVTRIIREQLEKRHKFFIVEMGAYGEGSIANLCLLAPPDVGVITCIGQAHMERFGSVATIFKAKFELAQATAKKNGTVVINGSRTPEELLSARIKKGEENFIVMRDGDDINDKDVTIKDIVTDKNGLSFTLVENLSDKDEPSILKVTAPIFGSHQAENIGLAIITAYKLGVPIDTIQASLQNLPQTRHRLELFKSDTSPWVLDDAYNSNPTGFAEALQTLNMLVKSQDTDSATGYLISPGMVEMGDDHDSEHYKIGKLAGQMVDVAAIVTPERIPTFIEGFNEGKGDKTELLTFSTQDEAQKWVNERAKKGDVILYENNLPDLFEAQVRF